jgi:hypothetical protein
MRVGFIHLSVGRARGLRTDRGQLLNCVPGSVNTRPSSLVLSSSRTRKPDTLSRLGIAGGTVYDVLVALAAKERSRRRGDRRNLTGPTVCRRNALRISVTAMIDSATAAQRSH